MVSSNQRDPLSAFTLPPLSQLEFIELESNTELALDGLQLPDSLRVLRLIGALPLCLRSLRFPAALRVLVINDSLNRSLSDLPSTVPPELRALEVSKTSVSVWREWVASNVQVEQRGCRVDTY